MAKMGRSSRSFMRYGEHAAQIGDVKMMRGESKKEVLAFMHRFDFNDRAVYFAENIQTMDRDEIKSTLSALSYKLEKIGAHGVIEIHPTADKTSKSAHIHYWGEMSEAVEKTITDFIKEHRLSNKTYLNYTNEEMYRGTSHAIAKGELVEYEFDRSDIHNISREDHSKGFLDEDEIALKNSVKKEAYYDDVIAFCDGLLAELDKESIITATQKAETVAEINYNDLHSYINGLEIDFYD